MEKSLGSKFTHLDDHWMPLLFLWINDELALVLIMADNHQARN